MVNRLLILVVDLDNTLILFDEEGYTKSLANGKHKLFVRKEFYRFIRIIYNLFGDENVFLVLWSTGENNYVNHMIQILNFYNFDLVLGANESNTAYEKYGCYKSPTYLLSRKEIIEWIGSKSDDISELPALVIIDDRALENTSESDCYDLAITPKPITLNDIRFDKCKQSFICKNVKSMIPYAFYLFDELVNKPISKVKFDTKPLTHRSFRIYQ